MGKIFKNMIPYWKSVIIIFLLLVVQAYCDLALPQYTSDIIDTGIQNCGVEHILPEKITSKEYGYTDLFMTKSEAAIFKSSYEKQGKLYVRTENDEERLNELDEQLILPIMMDYSMSMLPVESFNELFAKQMQGEQSQMGELSLEQLEQMFSVKLDTFTRKDTETNKEIECVDPRPLFKKLRDGVAMPNPATGEITTLKLSRKQLLTARETMEKEIETIGAQTMMSSGIAFAVDMNKQAGVDVDTIQTDYLWIAGIKMSIIAIIMMVVAILAGFFSSRVGAGIGFDLRGKMFKNVVSYSNGEIDKFSTASLITRTTNDVQQIQMVSVILLRMTMYAPIIGVGGVIKVVSTGAHMAWVIALGVAAILCFVALLMAVAMPKFKLMQTLVDKVNLVSREILTGIPVIRAFKREEREEQRFDEANRDLTKTMLFTNRVMTFMMPVMMMLMNGISILIVWVASGEIDNGTMQVGEMTAFITYSMLIVMSFLMFTMMSIMLPRAAVAAGRIEEVIKTPSSITDKANAAPLKNHKGVVSFNNVSFKYPGADENVIENINFTAEPNKTTAIIGSTGSGKSTIVNLIPRLYDVTEGSITIDGEDIRDITMESLREEIGYVPQKGILFSGTIASNLRFGNQSATDEEIAKAAQIAQATEFITAKAEGFDSSIAQGGTNVSGGQKQRLSIARAIAKNPKIYIFDDSFSALDMKTDAVLRKALKENVENCTVIIVAQRISTIMDAEQIIVLDEGKIAGIGTHKELLKSCDSYLEIAKSQLSSSELGLEKEGE